MSIPTSYLTSIKNLKAILNSIQGAQAPKRFTTRFLVSLGYQSVSDRLIIGVLKTIGFLNTEGAPTERYFNYLDTTQSKRVLADGIRHAYADLFQVNRNAHELSATEVKNKLKTLTQGQPSEAVLDKMASTFKALCQLADFAAPSTLVPETAVATTEQSEGELKTDSGQRSKPISLGGLVYNIQIVLPSDRDKAVYDALFRSLKEHLL